MPIFGVYDDLKVGEYLDFYGASYGIPAVQRRRIADDLLELVDLTHKREAYVDSLSRGMKQRLCLARSLVHDPLLLLLDEPASGLDPRARFEMRELLKELQRMGKTIIISSHILPELAEMCTHVGIIEAGQLVANGTIDEITHLVQSGMELEIKVLERGQEARDILENQFGLTGIDGSENHFQVPFGGDEKDLSRILIALVESGIPVISFAKSTNNLEDIFMQVTRGVVQ